MQVFRFRLPLKRTIKLGSLSLSYREGLLLHLNGMWAEASPLPGFSPETLVDVAQELADLEVGNKDFLHLPIRSSALRFAVDSLQPPSPQFAKSPAVVPINALLQGTPSEIQQKAARVVADGFSVIKIKVGRRHVEEDIRLLRDVREAVSSQSINIRLDANRAWDMETAVRFANETTTCGVQYIEEPLQDASQLEAFHMATGIPYALDETLQEGASLDRFPHAAALIIKPTLLGGRARMTALAATGKPLVFSACYESGIGLLHVARLAAELSPGVAAGLDTYDWLADDVLQRRLKLRGGMLTIPEAASVKSEQLNTHYLQEIGNA